MVYSDYCLSSYKLYKQCLERYGKDDGVCIQMKEFMRTICFRDGIYPFPNRK